ncbi:MAG: type II toxin-antitoxin system RelE/ParE family toxin [Candidatus Symbiothrix sp.]|jgi:plasmid stabilization system protein ParE|nr:type II toxin-antitoxin system RelE/ParE family toxin [Candidatus Symbiothrix sp.]
MVIKWTNKASLRLQSIHDYYQEVSNGKVAKNIIKEILNATKILSKYPQIAAVEPYLNNSPQVYRSLVVKPDYKIIYFIDGENIVIATIWNCRQNPENMRADVE